MFLDRDAEKLLVFKNFKNLNRKLTKAYMRKSNNNDMFSKNKGGALPENQVKMKQQDDETFDKVTTLFDKMMKRSRYGQMDQSSQSITKGSYNQMNT